MAAIPFVSRRQLRIEEVAGGMIGVVVGTATMNLDLRRIHGRRRSSYAHRCCGRHLSLDDCFTVIGRYGRYHRLDRASTRTSAQGGPYRARGDPGAGWAIVLERRYDFRQSFSTGARIRNGSVPLQSKRPVMIEKQKYIWLDGELAPWERANIHILSHAVMT